MEPVFKEAMENGLNLWDSAVVYGMGASENVLAAFIKKYPREDVMISTKFTPQIARSDANPVKEMCHGLTVLVSTILMFLLDSQSG